MGTLTGGGRGGDVEKYEVVHCGEVDAGEDYGAFDRGWMGAKGPPDFGHYREATHSHRPGGQKACNIITVPLLCSVVQFNPKTLQCIAVINSTRKLLGLYQY